MGIFFQFIIYDNIMLGLSTMAQIELFKVSNKKYNNSF